jgi:intein/homing endonuclease
LADIIGLFVAEGSYSYNSLRIYNTDKEVIDRLVNNNLGLNFRHYPKSQCICLDNARFIEFLKALGFPEHTSASTKFIPARLLRCSRDILCALLSGYADGDGHSNRHNGCTGCTSTSPLLAEQIRMLLLNFGILTKWQKDKRTTRTFKTSRSGFCNRESKLAGAIQLNSSPYFSERFYDRVGFGITYKQAKRSKLHKPKEQLFGLNDKFRALKAAHGCGSLGYNSMRRVMKAKFCTLDTAISKLRSWDKYADDLNYQFIKQRIAEFTAKKDAIVWLPITSLVASSSPVCELSVEAADHTYIANGFISHNSQVSRTVILAFVKKEGRDRKNAPAYKDHLCGTGRVDEDRMKRFFSEVTQICKHNVDHMRCVDALCRVIKADDKPGDGLIGKLVISSGLSRVQVNNFVRMIRLRSHEFTDSPLSQESDHDKQSRKQFLYQEEE